MSSHCRIRRVRLKSGGTVTPLRLPHTDDAQARLIRHAREIADSFKPGEMVGHVVIGWDSAGWYNLGFFVDDNSVIGRTLLPSWTADAIRRSLVSNGDW